MKRSTENLRHTRWECKYHVVFIPKYRKRSIYGWVRRELGPIIRDLAQQKESVVEEGLLMADMFTCCCRYPRSTRSRGWWGLSRARVPLRSHEGSWIGRRTLWDRTFGRGAITCQRWGGMKRRSEIFRHRARSWNKQRRIVVKIEVGSLGSNVRFVITNRPGPAQQIYDGYDGRGECENRIKEFKRDLSADRLSCHSYRANAFRLKLHALAYQLLVLFRLHALRATDLACARLQTLQLKLFKVGARFQRTARHLWFHLSSSWPGRDRFVAICRTLKHLPEPRPRLVLTR